MRKAIFNTTQSDLMQYNGTEVTVGSELTDAERDPEVGRMWRITFYDGISRDAYEDELTAVTTEENVIQAGLQKKAEEVLADRDENNYVEGYVQLHVSDLIDSDYEKFLDLLSVSLVDSDLLMDITYEIVKLADAKNELIFKVRGDASSVVEEEE